MNLNLIIISRFTDLKNNIFLIFFKYILKKINIPIREMYTFKNKIRGEIKMKHEKNVKQTNFNI